MKLDDILTEFKNDYSTQSGKRLTDDHFALAYKAIKSKEMDRDEIRDIAKEMADQEQFDRTVGSAEFVLNRMHILLHGMAPHGETPSRSDTMFKIPETMIKFAQSKGYDTFDNIKNAKEELLNRTAKVKKPQAMKIMADYYKANKQSFSKDITKYREAIIGDIMKGVAADKVFAKYS